MNRGVKDYLLRSMADDYESFEILFNEASRQAEEQGQPPSRAEAIEALEQLINEGLAKAYILSPTRSGSMPAEFSRRDVDQLWFYITPDGKRLISNPAALSGGI